MKDLTDKAVLCTRAEAHAALLETAATLMELDGFGLAPEQGHVHHLRRMAGAIRAQAALGQVAQSYSGGRYLPAPEPSHAVATSLPSSKPSGMAWH